MNPNEQRADAGKQVPIVGQSNEAHCKYVWEHFVLPCKASEVYVVAHSRGGKCIGEIIEKFKRDFCSRVRGLALTDAINYGVEKIFTHKEKQWGEAHAKHWVVSKQPLGTKLEKRKTPIWSY